MSVREGLRLPRRAHPAGDPARATGEQGLSPGAHLRPLARSALVVIFVLLLVFVVGWMRLARQAGAGPASLEELGLWPVGLGAGLAVLAHGTRQRIAALLAVASVTLGAGVAAGAGDATTATLALGAAAEAWVLASMVARDADGRARLLDLADLIRLATASLAAGAAGAVVAGLAIVSGALGDSPSAAIPVLPVVAVSHVLSHVLVVSFFLRVPREPPTAGRGEIALQAVLVALVAPLVFVPDFPGTVFLVFPLLVWAAMRCGFRFALAQPILLGVIAAELTLRGLGPFASGQPELPAPVVGVVLLQAYVLSASAVVLPLALAVATMHRRATEATRERQRAEGLVRSTVGTAIVATDLSGHVRLANPGAVELFGYDDTALTSLSVADLFPDGELSHQAGTLGVPPDLVSVMEAMSGVPGERREWVVQRADGAARAHLLGFARLTDERGAVTGYVLTSEDITERIRLQESLTAALVVEREVVQRMEELDGVKDALVSSVSHELRTPITSILGFVEMLRDGDYGPLTAEQARAMGRVSDNGSRLLTLIDDLLSLARMQDGTVELDLQPLDLCETVRATWGMLEGRLRDRELRVSLQLPDTPARTCGDKNQLERLLVNLVGNAIKFTPDGGEVVVRLRQLGDRLSLEVSDTGIGIPEDEQGQLFGRFFRSSLAAQQAIQGTGLGLSIVKAIAEQHGGGVSVESHPGRGSTFRVDLPAFERAPAAPESAPVCLEPAPVAPEPSPVDVPEVQVAATHAESADTRAESAGVAEPGEVDGRVDAPAPLSVASRLAVAQHAAPGADPDDATRAILDAFGPRLGRGSTVRNI